MLGCLLVGLAVPSFNGWCDVWKHFLKALLSSKHRDQQAFCASLGSMEVQPASKGAVERQQRPSKCLAHQIKGDCVFRWYSSSGPVPSSSLPDPSCYKRTTMAGIAREGVQIPCLVDLAGPGCESLSSGKEGWLLAGLRKKGRRQEESNASWTAVGNKSMGKPRGAAVISHTKISICQCW